MRSLKLIKNRFGRGIFASGRRYCPSQDRFFRSEEDLGPRNYRNQPIRGRGVLFEDGLYCPRRDQFFECDEDLGPRHFRNRASACHMKFAQDCINDSGYRRGCFFFRRIGRGLRQRFWHW